MQMYGFWRSAAAFRVRMALNLKGIAVEETMINLGTPAYIVAEEDLRARARVRALALIWAADHHPLIVPRVRAYLVKTLHADKDQETAWIQHWFREGLTISNALVKIESELPPLAEVKYLVEFVRASERGISK